MKSILPLLAVAGMTALATPGLACEQHQAHAALKTAEQAPPTPPQIVIEPAAQSVPTLENETVRGAAAISKPTRATDENCNRARDQGKTVYLTQ